MLKHSHLFALCASLACCWASLFAQRISPLPLIPSAPHTPQEVLLLLTGGSAEDRIILTLNNNRDGLLKTSLTVYGLNGRSTPLNDVEMANGESLQVELSPLLAKAGLAREPLGWLKLNYSGAALEMGAQLTLYPQGSPHAIDSPRSLASDFKSSKRSSSFWMPLEGTASLALTNASTAEITVHMNCGALRETFTIYSLQTSVRQILPNPLLFNRDANGGFPVGCDLETSGSPSALRTIGFVRSGKAFSAPIRFYDPETATFSSLTAVGIRVGAKTYVTVHNVTDEDVTFTTTLTEASLSNPLTLSSAPSTVHPHSSALVAVDALLKEMSLAQKGIATLSLHTTAVKGSIVGAVTQVDTDDLVEDIPLRTSNPAATARGSYPIRWDEGYTNLISVTNTAAHSLKIGATITAKNLVYVIKREDIAPGATAVFDVDHLKNDHIQDVNGRVLPSDARYGKFHWIEMGMGKNAGLLGRASVSSVKDGRRSSFSCGSSCYYSFDGYPFYSISPFAFLAAGDYQVSQMTEHIAQTNGVSYDYPLSYFPGIVADNSNLLTFSNSDDYLVITPNEKGSSYMYYYMTINQPYYQPDEEACYDNVTNPVQDGTGTSADATPMLTGIKPSTWIAGTTQAVTFTGINFGANTPNLNFSPSSGLSYSIVSHSDTSIETSLTVAPGTPDSDVVVSVTSNGSGAGFYSGGGGGTSQTSNSMYARVSAPFESPEITVVGWVNGNTPELTNIQGGGYLVRAALNSGFFKCAATVGLWALGAPVYLFNQSDREYAQLLLVSRSGNAEPQADIDIPFTRNHGDYRLFNDFGAGTGSVSIGNTPDPCGSGPFTAKLRSPETHYANGQTGTSVSQRKWQLAEGRIGTIGQAVNRTLGAQSTPWIWGVVEFDNNLIPYVSDHSDFPTFYIYENGHRMYNWDSPQTSVLTFQGRDQSYQRYPFQIQ